MLPHRLGVACAAPGACAWPRLAVASTNPSRKRTGPDRGPTRRLSRCGRGVELKVDGGMRARAGGSSWGRGRRKNNAREVAAAGRGVDGPKTKTAIAPGDGREIRAKTET